MLFEVFKLGLAGVISVRDSKDSLVEIYVTEDLNHCKTVEEDLLFQSFAWCPTVCSWCKILRLLLRICVF